jgi:hypothetical protein
MLVFFYFTPTKKNRKSNGGLTSQYWPRTIVRCVMPIQAWNAVDVTNWAQIQNPCSSATPELIKTALSITWQQNIFLKCSETCLNYPFSTTWARFFYQSTSSISIFVSSSAPKLTFPWSPRQLAKSLTSDALFIVQSKLIWARDAVAHHRRWILFLQ